MSSQLISLNKLLNQINNLSVGEVGQSTIGCNITGGICNIGTDEKDYAINIGTNSINGRTITIGDQHMNTGVIINAGSSNVNIANISVSTDGYNGSLVVAGGVGIGQNINVNSTIRTYNTYANTASATISPLSINITARQILDGLIYVTASGTHLVFPNVSDIISLMIAAQVNDIIQVSVHCNNTGSVNYIVGGAGFNLGPISSVSVGNNESRLFKIQLVNVTSGTELAYVY